MYWSLIFFILWIVFISLLVLKILISLILKKIRKRDTITNRKYTLDRLEESRVDDKVSAVKYLSNSADSVKHYYLFNDVSSKKIGIVFNEEINFNHLYIYEYNKSKKLINILEISNYNDFNNNVELVINKNTEFINIITTTDKLKIKPLKKHLVSTLFDILMFYLFSLLIMNTALNFVVGNMKDTFIDDNLYVITYLSSLFIFINIMFLVNLFNKRNLESGSEKL